MEREIDLSQISDGKLYTAGDMVKVGCKDCFGCSGCCRGMGSSIVLDSYDMYQLEKGLDLDFAQLMTDKIELNVVEGLIQPNLKMQPKTDACAFLNQEGRCSIHNFRPGFCRMFPLGRIYDGEAFRYFLQIHECPYPEKTKVKLKKWLDIPELSKYENYICRWHYFLKEFQQHLRSLQTATVQEEAGTDTDEMIKNLNLHFLNEFYVLPYNHEQDFYEQFDERLQKFQKDIF